MFSGLRLIHFLLHTKSNLMKSRIAMKIAAGFIAVIALMILMLWISRLGYNNILGNVNNLETLAAKQITAGNLRFKTAQLLMAVSDYILTGKDKYREDYARHDARIDTHTVKLQMQKLEPIEKSILASILLNIDSIRSIAKRVFEMSDPRASDEAVVLMESMDYDYGEKVNRKTTELFDHITRRIDEEHDIVAHVKARTAIIHALVLVLGSLISLIVTYLVMTRIAKPIVTVTQAANALAKGDYSHRPSVATHDEVADLAQSFCSMADDIQQSHRTLEHAKRLNESIVHSIPPGIIVFDSEAQIISVNKRVEELFNIEPGDFIRTQAEDFLEHIGVMEECRETIHARKPVRDLECRCECPRRGEMWLNLTLTPFTVRSEWNGEYHQYVLVMNDITERKRVEDQLRQLSLAVEQTAEMVFITDRNGIIKYVNPAFEQLTGYAKEEAIGRTPRILKSDTQDDDYYKKLWETILAGNVFRAESVNRKKNGDLYHAEQTITPIRNEGGSITHFVSNCKDITERKRAEEELRKSQTLLSTVFDASRDGIILEDRNGMIVYANKAFAEIYGYESPSELTGIPISSVQSEQDNSRMMEYGQKRLKGEPAPTLYEFKGKKKDGTLIDLEVSVSTTMVGDELCIVSLVRDIAERKQREDLLTRLHVAIEQTADSVVITNVSGVIQYVNPAFERESGYAREEIIGENMSIIKSGAHSTQFYEEMWKTLLTGKAFKATFTNKNKTGDLYFEKKTITPIKDSEGNIQCFINTAKTVTEEIRAETTLRQRAEELQAIYKLSNNVSRAESLKSIFDEAMDTLLQVLKADRVSILLFDHDGIMRFQAWRNLSESYRQAADGHSPWSSDARNPQPILIEDVDREPALDHLRPVIVSEGIKAMGFLPLVHQDRLLGKFMIYYNNAHPFAENEIRVAQTIASHVAFAIERKRAEEAIRQSETLLAEAQRIAHLGSWDWNVISEKLRWSDEVYRIFGLQPKGITPTFELFLNAVHPDDRDSVRESVNRALYEKEPYSIDHRIILPDGMEKYVHEEATVYYDDSGQAIRMSGTAQDITERMNTEIVLRESEERYRLLFEQSVEAIYLCDVKTLRIKEANTAFMRLLGYSEDEVRSLTLFDFVAEDRKSIQRVLDRLSTEGSFIIGERRWKRKDGNVANVEVTVSTFLQQGERTLYVIARDITERKRSEKMLIESEKKYRALAESTNALLFSTDTKGRFTFVNEAAVRTLGTSESQLIGSFYLRFVHPDDRRNVHPAFLRQLVEKSTNRNIEFRYLTRENRTGWLSFFVSSIFQGGTVVGLTGVALDITERKHAEQKLQEMNAQLELALKYQELFIANMTHEIRTPLNVILGYTGYIMDIGAKKFSQEEAEFFESIDGAGKRLMRTVDNVLQMTSFQTGLIKIKLQRQDVSPAVRSIVREMQGQASEKGLTLEVGALEEPLHAIIDRYALEQALVNLIDNAIKYTNTGGIVVNLKRIEDHAYIEVHDTGIGISEEFLPKIFAAFTQESTGYTRAYQGLGLGLSLVKNYLSATGGTIAVQSKKGEGSTFSIVFPLA